MMDPFHHTYSDASTWSILTDHLSYTRHPEAKTGSLKFFENFNRQNQWYVQSSNPHDSNPTDITATAPDIYFEKFDEVKVNVCEVTQFNGGHWYKYHIFRKRYKGPLSDESPIFIWIFTPFYCPVSYRRNLAKWKDNRSIVLRYRCN